MSTKRDQPCEQCEQLLTAHAEEYRRAEIAEARVRLLVYGVQDIATLIAEHNPTVSDIAVRVVALLSPTGEDD